MSTEHKTLHDHLANHHGLVLLESELQEIERLVADRFIAQGIAHKARLFDYVCLIEDREQEFKRGERVFIGLDGAEYWGSNYKAAVEKGHKHDMEGQL